MIRYCRPTRQSINRMPSSCADIFEPNQVTLNLRATTQNDAILETAELLRTNGRVTQYYEFADAVMEREGRSSTNTGEGIAFPHARTDLVSEIVLAIGRSKSGVRFTGSTEPVHLIFLLGVPQKMVTAYLVCVGSIARIVRPDDARAALMSATTPKDFVAILRDAPSI